MARDPKNVTTAKLRKIFEVMQEFGVTHLKTDDFEIVMPPMMPLAPEMSMDMPRVRPEEPVDSLDFYRRSTS